MVPGTAYSRSGGMDCFAEACDERPIEMSSMNFDFVHIVPMSDFLNCRWSCSFNWHVILFHHAYHTWHNYLTATLWIRTHTGTMVNNELMNKWWNTIYLFKDEAWVGIIIIRVETFPHRHLLRGSIPDLIIALTQGPWTLNILSVWAKITQKTKFTMSLPEKSDRYLAHGPLHTGQKLSWPKFLNLKC